MIAVLFNNGGVRLGEVQIPEECRLIEFGGAYFTRAVDSISCELDRGGFTGVVFEESYNYVKRDLDIFNPTKDRRQKL